MIETPTPPELVDMYLAQHDAQPERTANLRWLLHKATHRFAEVPITELVPAESRARRTAKVRCLLTIELVLSLA